MIEEVNSGNSGSRLMASRMNMKQKQASKLSFYQTNIENFTKNQNFNVQKIDPKGIAVISIFGSFSGVIESAELFTNCEQTLHLSYKVCMGQQWHDETPETDDTEGQSNFCCSKNGKVSISLGFDFLVSSMYISSWPKVIITVSGFNYKGELIPKGYAHIDLPSQSGQFMRQAFIYSIIRNESWYHRWLPFFEVTPSALDEKQIERVIVKGEGRQSEKIKCLGVLNVRVQTLLRNFERFGYK